MGSGTDQEEVGEPPISPSSSPGADAPGFLSTPPPDTGCSILDARSAHPPPSPEIFMAL
jgi:hypothetical protein